MRAFLKHAWLCRHLPNLAKTEWYTREQIKAYQEKRLRKIIYYAYKHIPYYRKQWDELKINPSQINSLEDLKKIPPLTREQALLHYDELTCPSKFFGTHSSSATTGQRIKWAYSYPWMHLFGKALWRGFGWAGLQKDKRVVSFFSRMVGKIVDDCLLLREAFDATTIEDELEKVRQFKPQFAYSYASSAYMTARYLINNQMTLPLQAVVVTGDQLLPHYREVIEEAFQCKVYNNYGCNDGGAWGAECPMHTGFHQDFERSIIEFDESGKMLLTDLWNEAMPFIRYENGDTGKWLEETCPCGRAHPLFTAEGKVGDYIITPHKIFSPTTVGSLLRAEYLTNLQVVQQNEREIEIYYTHQPGFETQAQEMFTNFTDQLKGMEVKCSFSSYRILTPSQKYRLCVNRSNQTIDQFLTI